MKCTHFAKIHHQRSRCLEITCISNLKNVAMQQDHTRIQFRVVSDKTADTICIGDVAEVENFGVDREGFTGKCKANVRCRVAGN
jgi:hypothetical protein